MSLESGVYRISNHFSPVVLDLSGGKGDDKTAIVAWHDNRVLNQAWFIEGTGGTDTYTIRNVSGGSYMDLSGASADNGTQIIGYHQNNAANQHWVVRKTSGGSYKIQNAAAQTFVELKDGGSSDGTGIVGWKGDWDSDNGGHQAWDFTRISLSADQVRNVVKAHPNLGQDFPNYVSDTPFLLLSQDRISEIWKNSGLGNTVWRSEIFDCDDFALTFKAAVADWGNKNIQADGFALLCGVMYGQKPGAAHAYNWYMVDGQPDTIILFEPQTGEVNPPGLDYKAYFGLF